MARERIIQAIVNIAGTVGESVNRSVNDVNNQLNQINQNGANIAKTMGIMGAAVGAAAIAGTAYLADLGDDYKMAMNQLTASTTLSKDEVDALGDVMQNVYKSNYGDSFDDVSAGMTAMYKTTWATGQELENLTKNGFALRDTFGYELEESARAAKAMMTNFGVSGDEAMNLIAAGAQNGLDYSGELIDSINEYSVQFAKIGLSADDMFNIFQSGADSGAWNLDKVGDAVKEFSIRAIDGSKTSTEAYAAIGLNADEMMQTFVQGGDGATKAFHKVINQLMAMDDKVARDAAGVGLFGTMWEDLGVDAMQAMADMQTGAYDTGEELDKINDVKYDNLGAAFETIKRQLEVGLIPAATMIADGFMAIAPKIGEMVNEAAPYLNSLAETVGPIVIMVVDFAVDGIGFLADNMDVLAPIIAGVTGALVAYKIAAFLAAAATTGGTVSITFANIATGAWTIVSGIAATATSALATAFAFLTSPIGLVLLAIAAVIAIGILLYKNWDFVKEKAAELGTYLFGVWESIRTAVGGFITGIKTSFMEGFGALAGIVKGPINAVIGIVNGAIGAINSVGFDVPDWVPIIGGKSFKINIPKMPLLAAGGFTEGVSIAGEAGQEAVISFDQRYRTQNIGYWEKAGQMLGVYNNQSTDKSLSVYNNQSMTESAKAGRMLAGSDVTTYTLEGDSNTTNIDLGGVSFAPQITVEGGADQRDIMAAIEGAFPEFIDLLEQWLFERGRTAYEH